MMRGIEDLDISLLASPQRENPYWWSLMREWLTEEDLRLVGEYQPSRKVNHGL